MDKVNSNGQMAGNTPVNILRISEIYKTIWLIKKKKLYIFKKLLGNMAMVFSNGQMAENIKEIGRMENSMEKESTLDLMDKREKENGKKERESSGLKRMEMSSDQSEFL